MKRFFAYEEYGAQYELMSKYFTSTLKTALPLHAYERGIEALSTSLTSVNHREASCNKGLTFVDLIIKVCGMTLVPK